MIRVGHGLILLKWSRSEILLPDLWISFGIVNDGEIRGQEPEGTSMNEDPSRPPAGAARRFATTRWSMVLSAAGGIAESEAALGELCRIYWFPVYAYVRRRGNSPADAEDLTQGFFHHLIERRSLAGVRREGGRFRSFLLAAVENFLSNDYHRRHAKKRGGGQGLLSLDSGVPEERYALDAPDADTPETLFQKRWAFTLLQEATDRLSRECSRAGKGDLFEALHGHLLEHGAGEPYAILAGRLGMSEGALKVAVHRLRNRFGLLLREMVADTVAEPAEIDSELRHLISVLGQ